MDAPISLVKKFGRSAWCAGVIADRHRSVFLPQCSAVGALDRLRRWLYRLPLELRARGIRGYERILGIEWVVLTTKSKLTGRPQRVIVDVVGQSEAGDTLFISSANGRDSRWVQNLLAHPDVSVEVEGHVFDATARDVTGDEGGRVMLRFIREHPRYARVVASLGAFEDVSGHPDEEAEAQLRSVVVIELAVTLRAHA